MEIQTIIFILLAFVIGGVVSWLIMRRQTSPEAAGDVSVSANEASELKNQVELLKQQIADVDAKAIADMEVKEAEIRSKYESLIQQIKEENTRLDSALKLATEGKIDESIQSQLAAAEKSMSTIKEMECQLNDLRLKHSELLAECEPLREDLEQSKTQCTSLTQKVKKLEEELEDAEDEQESLEKKLKNKTKELQESQIQLEESSRQNKHLAEDLAKRETELANSIDALKLKKESIQFVQAILSAKENGASDIKTLYRSIDYFESYVMGQYMDCNAYLFNTYSSLSYNNKSGRDGFIEKKRLITQALEEWAAVKRKSWLDQKTTIAFVGEFSAGKTSIVNRILSQDNPNVPLLPVSAKATTAIPTYIAGGPGETYSFVTPDDKLKSITEDIFKKISKEVLDEIKGISSLIKYFVMTYKNPNLEGLSILDTPGFNSNDKEDRNRTIEVINECDALFWVIDVNSGTLNRTSIELIKEKLNKPLIVVINKVDTKPTSEVDKVEASIKKNMLAAGIKVERFVRFSAKAPLADIMNPIHSIKRDDRRDSFVANLGEDMQNLSTTINCWINGAGKKYHSCEQRVKETTDKFIDQLGDLIYSCARAKEIPQFKSGTKVLGIELKEDRYEMSIYKGKELKDLLEDISDSQCQALATLFDNETEAAQNAQQAYSNLIDLKTSWQKIDDCLSEYKKVSKKVK